MKILKIIQKLKLSNAVIVLVGLTLIACGGGTSSESITIPNTPNNNLQPRSLNAADMSNVSILAREAAPAPQVTNDSDTITITHTGSEISSALHYQFFINTDNNAATGFNFSNEVWDDAGTDYIVEDGDLFKSTANDSSWSWDTNVGEVDYKLTDTSVSVTINQALLSGLAPQIRIGFIIRDENWDVISIWPGASLMALASLNITPPVDNIAPVISLNGAQNITLQRGTAFNDPGATAIDNFDGDISDQILSFSNLDTSTIGNYQVTYEVEDSAGNKDTKIRFISVTENASNTIVIDGEINDWSEIPVLTSSGVASIKVTDTITNLYILIEGFQPLGENTQIFIDSDNNSFNGFRFNDSVWSEGGADYMVENNLLSRSTENSTRWAWEHDYRPISYINSNNIIEVAIPKSVLKIKRNLAPKIRVGFVNRDADWNVESVLPEDGMKRHQLTAINTLNLIPGFCGKIWETDGTAENTQESFLNTYNGTWGNLWERKGNNIFGVRYIESTTENLISFEKYRGTFQNVQYLPFQIVRPEPLENGKVTAMKFIGDTLYFIFENELWRTDGSGAGTIRLKIFEDNPNKSYRLFTTSSDVYVYEQSIRDSIKNLWKLENGEFLTQLDLTGDEFIAVYKDKLYTSRQDGSGDYVVIENNSGLETILSPSFAAQPRLSSTNGALYISDASFNDDRSKFFWRLNEGTSSFIKVTSNAPGGAGSVSSSFRGMSYVSGNEFVYNQTIAFSKPTATLYSILNTDERNVIKKTGRIKSYYLDGDLYINARNYLSEGIRQTETDNELLVINDPSGKLKSLATCNITE